jgi:D-psicose/D-tagatose/L-ribulose 3-epimerase
MSTLGLHTFALAPQWDVALVERKVDLLKEYGVGLIEVPLARPGDVDARLARAFANRHGLALAAALLPARPFDAVGEPQEALDFLQPVLATAAELGSAALYGLSSGGLARITGRPADRRELDGYARFLDRAARAARAVGLMLCIQPCSRYEGHLINRAGDAAAMIERIGAENLMVELDTFPMQLEEESFAAAFEAAAPHLGYVRLSEANRGIPGRGLLDWPAAFTAIAASGYNGPMTLVSLGRVGPEMAARLRVWRPVADDPDEVVTAGVPFLRAAARQAGVALD